MNEIELFAKPFWVNFLILVPVFLFFYFGKHKLSITKRTLLFTFVFGVAFGVIEASCVVYLRAAAGLLPGYEGTLLDVWRQSDQFYNNQILLEQLPMSLLAVELIREVGTIVMLWMVAFISAQKIKERIAVFLWAFAVWDIVYYAHFFLTVRWPQSLTTPDVLFLIPEPWSSQVWFPILVSGLTMIAVFINSKDKSQK
ncbi:MAG: hypothetical protein AAB521_03410 [Patescibacteria group bacterium]